MAYYDMKCSNCQEVTEINCKHEELEAMDKRTCPKCSHVALERIYTGGPVAHFKGTGFFATDYKRKR